jgi:hypothetical protein
MANSSGNYGMTAIGPQNPNAVFEFDVDPSATQIFLNDPVTLVADQGVAQAAAGGLITGVAVGFLDSDGLPRSYYYQGGSSSATGWKCQVNIQRDQRYMTKCSAALTAADVGGNADIVVASGSTTTGLSGNYITTVSSISAQVRVLGLHESPGNDWGANQDVIVVINEDAFVTVSLAGI